MMYAFCTLMQDFRNGDLFSLLHLPNVIIEKYRMKSPNFQVSADVLLEELIVGFLENDLNTHDFYHLKCFIHLMSEHVLSRGSSELNYAYTIVFQAVLSVLALKFDNSINLSSLKKLTIASDYSLISQKFNKISKTIEGAINKNEATLKKTLILSPNQCITRFHLDALWQNMRLLLWLWQKLDAVKNVFVFEDNDKDKQSLVEFNEILLTLKNNMVCGMQRPMTADKLAIFMSMFDKWLNGLNINNKTLLQDLESLNFLSVIEGNTMTSQAGNLAACQFFSVFSVPTHDKDKPSILSFTA